METPSADYLKVEISDWTVATPCHDSVRYHYRSSKGS